MKEIEYILLHFEEHFGSLKGKRIALYPGEYLDEVVRSFDGGYRFCRILEPDCTEVPADTDAVILTDRRTGKEPDYNRIWRSCEDWGVLLLDLFGLDQIKLHRELKAQQFLSIAEWIEILRDYEVVTVLIAGAVAKYFQLQGRWVIRSRFLTVYDWLKSQGKTVLFLWDTEEQIEPLLSKLEGIEDCLIKREGNDQGFLRLAMRYRGKKMIHIGVGTVRDGIIPREYGMDSRLFRYFSCEVSTGGGSDWFCADKQQLIEEIDRHDVISFDVFDTLLKRTVLHPETVFEMVEERTGVKGFAASRRQIQAAFPKFSLDQIYDRMRDDYGYDNETLESLRRTELQIESTVIMRRNSMAEIFEYAKKQGKTLILVSDMYLSSDFIRQLLEENGFSGYCGLYVSNESGMFKHEGLYEELLKHGKDHGKILHIGDNYFSDYLSAQEYGLDAFHIPSGLELARKNGYDKIISACSTAAERKLLGLSIALGFDDPFEQDKDVLIANMVIAPLALGYLLWACEKLAAKKYDYYLLSSRDGWILKDAYDKMQSRSGGRLPMSKYLYVNRHAAFLTVMDDSEMVKKMIYLPDRDDELPNVLYRQFNLSAGKVLPYRGESPEEYFRLHGEIIRKAAGRYRENYRKYLKQEGIGRGSYAFMDLFAAGTSQEMLEKHLVGPMDGYYAGVPEYVSEYAENVCYYFDQELLDYDTLMKSEVYFTSMEPALDHINDQGQPVFAAETRSKPFMNRIERIHRMVRGYLDRYLDMLADPGDVIHKEQIFEMCKTVNNYEVENEYFEDMIGRPIKTRP